MNEIVNVLNLPNRTDRLRNFEIQASEQEFKYKVWDGEIDKVATFRGISNGHKKIVNWAKATHQPFAFIAEDDAVFLGTGAWKYYLENMPESFDLYLGMIYEGEIDENNRIIKHPLSFSGLTIYCVHERFYNAFLNMNSMNNLDRELGTYADKYEYYVCPQFVCKQMNGFSDNKKKVCFYDKKLIGRKLYVGINS